MEHRSHGVGRSEVDAECLTGLGKPLLVVLTGRLSNAGVGRVQGSHTDTLVEVSGLEPPTSTLRT